MNAENTVSPKIFICGLAALALTAVMSWSFLEATSSGRWLVQNASTLTTAVVAKAGVRAAQVAQAALVD